MTLYDIKPRFQTLLRPGVKLFADLGVTANQVTIAAAVGSVVVGFLLFYVDSRRIFILLPVWMFVRMALNAVDGMLAREFRQKSKLGAYLNEISDVMSDAALYIPFAFVAPFSIYIVGLVVFFATLSEFAGVLGLTVGASRRYDGPLGKSDRALVFGALGLWVGCGGGMPAWLYWVMPVLLALIGLTIINRVKQALAEAEMA